MFLVLVVLGAGLYFFATRPSGPTVTSFSECEAAGYAVSDTAPRTCTTPDRVTFTESVAAPTETPQVGTTDERVRLVTPRVGETVGSPLAIEGEARGTWYFEGSFPVRLEDASGLVLAQGIATAKGEWMTEDFVPFTAELTWEPQSGPATLILERDNPSGLPENAASVRVPLTLTPEAPTTMEVQAFFQNTQRDPDMLDCGKVYPVTRTVEKVPGVGRAALTELLKGPSTEEEAQGYKTALNENVPLNTLTIVDGVAKVDFGADMERAVGGSCRVQAIRAQVTETLKQFPTVREVVISVDGRVEDALQP